MKIYTKTGDKGETGLVGGSRVSKSDSRIQALGDIDELNAVLGVAKSHAGTSPLMEHLSLIQDELFQIGSEIASVPGARLGFQLLEEGPEKRLEASIDEMTQALPPLTSFILPGGCQLAAYLHEARAVCRRAERSTIRLREESEIRSEILRYLNRLSDWFFVAARKANHDAGVEDTKWTPQGT